MGVIDKIKNLHKQTLLKLKDIKRAVIADEAGVNNEEYLSRARTLSSYLNPNQKEEEDSKDEETVNAEETMQYQQKEQQTVSPAKTSSKSTSKKSKSINL